MSKKLLKIIYTLSIITLISASCVKGKSCYSEKLYQENKDNFCTMDCPGVIGCDGKTYCNECVANTKGIRVD